MSSRRANKVLTIAVTGSTGFVGKAVMVKLRGSGHCISVLMRNPVAGQSSLQSTQVKGDLQDMSVLAELVKGADAVIHIAGAIAAPSEAEFFKTNFLGTRNIFNAAKAAGVKRFVHVSSLAARMPEISAYAKSKRAGEDCVQNTVDMSCVIIRPSAVYGPGDRATFPLLQALQRRNAFIPGHADSRFSLIHVEDLAGVIVDAMQSDVAGVFEVDDLDGGHMWSELVDLNFKLSSLPRRVFYVPRFVLWPFAIAVEWWSKLMAKPGLISREKLAELYHQDWVVRGANWQRGTSIRLSVGLPATLTWYRKEGWLPPLSTPAKSDL
jgi:nucleoside-diphosphate-sugar epimerase